MTATTISSLMPSVSTLGLSVPSVGEGGGVCSSGPRRPVVRPADKVAEAVEDGEGSGESDCESCDLFTFLDGGSESSVA